MDYELATSTVMEDREMAEQPTRREDYVFQQAVTLTAHLVYGDQMENGKTWIEIFGYRVPVNYLPLVIAMTFGIMMILVLVSSLILWRYCWMARRKNETPEIELIQRTSQSYPRNGLLHVLRNGPWTYATVGPKTNQPNPTWMKNAHTQQNQPTAAKESPTYIRQISPSNSITLNIENNNFVH